AAPCISDSVRCRRDTVQRCDDTGHWQDDHTCSKGVELCHRGQCEPLPLSCRGGPLTTSATFDCPWGPDQTESCCASDEIPGGTFRRDPDGDGGIHEATVSTFRLDDYEVTVGRFRRFVETVVQTGWVPPPGS